MASANLWGGSLLAINIISKNKKGEEKKNLKAKFTIGAQVFIKNIAKLSPRLKE